MWPSTRSCTETAVWGCIVGRVLLSRQIRCSFATIKKRAQSTGYNQVKGSEVDDNEQPYLIFVQFAILVLLFSFILKSDDNETDKDVNHEEGNDNDVDEIKAGDQRSVVVHRAFVLRVRINRHIQQPVHKSSKEKCNEKSYRWSKFAIKRVVVAVPWPAFESRDSE